MDAKPEQSSGADPSEHAVERYGPLEVRRLRKDDGRQLIVYTRVEPPESSEP